MGIKDQLIRLKDNWLIITIVLIGLLAVSGMPGAFTTNMKSGFGMMAYDSAESYRGSMPAYDSESFAPGVTERIKLITAYMTNEVKTGEFDTAISAMQDILSSKDAYVLNENIYSTGEGWKEYKRGSFTIKINTEEFDDVVSKLKTIGEVKSFSENTDDVTGTYQNLNIELESERQRLARFTAMLSSAEDVSDQIELTDRIFNIERTIKYYEERISGIDERVEYSTLYLNINEKRSGYADITIVKFSNLVKSMTSSFNSMLSLVFTLIPWLVLGALLYLGYRITKRRN